MSEKTLERKWRISSVLLVIAILVGLPLSYQLGQNALLPELKSAKEQIQVLERELQKEKSQREAEEEALRKEIQELKANLSFAIKTSVSPEISNNWYVLIFDSAEPNADVAPDFIYEFLTGSEKIPSEHIFTLRSLNATAENLVRTLEKLASQLTKDDFLYLVIATHGVNEGFVCYRQGVTEPWQTCPPEAEKSIIFTYRELDECLDKIKVRAMLIMITACLSGEETLFEALKDESRTIVTAEYGGLVETFLEALGYKLTTDISFRYVFIENPGNLRTLHQKDYWVKERYNSLTEVYQAIDKDKNGYLSISEALEWTQLLRYGCPDYNDKMPPEDRISKNKNHCTIDNLSATFNLYFGYYTPKELGET